jgi:hypothetical protein
LLDSNFSNAEQNYFEKIYRAKTPSTQRKTLTHIPNLGAFCAFARDIVFRSLFQFGISNMFGESFFSRTA